MRHSVKYLENYWNPTINPMVKYTGTVWHDLTEYHEEDLIAFFMPHQIINSYQKWLRRNLLNNPGFLHNLITKLSSEGLSTLSKQTGYSKIILNTIDSGSLYDELFVSLIDKLDSEALLIIKKEKKFKTILTILCKRYVGAVITEENSKIQVTKNVEETKDAKIQVGKAVPAKKKSSSRNKMHQMALGLLSQPILDKTILTSIEWLMIGESMLLSATDGNEYLTATQNIPDDEKRLPESTLVNSCHRLRRAAFCCLEAFLPQTEEEAKGQRLEEESSEKAGAKTLFFSYLGLNCDEYKNASLENKIIQDGLTELDDRAKRVEKFPGWDAFSHALIGYLKEIKPSQEAFKTQILKLKYHFELAAGKPDTLKAQEIAIKMKKHIFQERNDYILDLSSFEKLQQLWDLISVVCSSPVEEKITRSSIFFSNQTETKDVEGDESVRGLELKGLLTTNDLRSDTPATLPLSEIDDKQVLSDSNTKEKLIKKLDNYINDLDNRSKRRYIAETTRKTLKQKHLILSAIKKDLDSEKSVEELNELCEKVIDDHPNVNTFCYRLGTSSSLFCCCRKTSTLKLIEETRDCTSSKKSTRL